MTKDPDPGPGDGLGWHPAQTWLATYDAATLERLEFAPAPNSGTTPIYGYAVASDDRHTYLFGNTFDQNLARQGGWQSGPHSATTMWLARVPRGRLGAEPEYRAAPEWSTDPAAARPIASRFWAENPMQPRFIGDQWVAATKRDGFWGEELYVDVAVDPWGPWTTVSRVLAEPRAGDPLMNTYHAHLMPWLENGSLVVSMSQNARDMLEDAFPHPERYRLQFLRSPLVPPPPTPPPTTTTTTAPPPPDRGHRPRRRPRRGRPDDDEHVDDDRHHDHVAADARPTADHDRPVRDGNHDQHDDHALVDDHHDDAGVDDDDGPLRLTDRARRP